MKGESPKARGDECGERHRDAPSPHKERESARASKNILYNESGAIATTTQQQTTRIPDRRKAGIHEGVEKSSLSLLGVRGESGDRGVCSSVE